MGQSLGQYAASPALMNGAGTATANRSPPPSAGNECCRTGKEIAEICRERGIPKTPFILCSRWRLLSLA